ncbi:MAG TPA: hypothetical protein VNP02_07995 [Gammaproteobacteria bacterium]|jgi:hypothetical protein|nr:hypothetical protein [Gammaproteobacteria bacterium]
MASTPKPKLVASTPAASRPIAPPAAAHNTPGEHILIGSDDFAADPATVARTPGDTVVLRNPIRRTGAQITFYDEGYLKVTELEKGSAEAPFLLDLRFVDPVPKIERVIAMRWLTAAFGCGAMAVLAAFLLRFDAFHTAALWALGVAALGTVVALYVGVYSSHEKIEFCTLHGRAAVLQLVANLGSIKKFHSFVPMLCRAIEEAAERIGADTSAYLRAEMREHYRLRGDGVLDNDECARGTGRILAQFDVQL